MNPFVMQDHHDIDPHLMYVHALDALPHDFLLLMLDQYYHDDYALMVLQGDVWQNDFVTFQDLTNCYADELMYSHWCLLMYLYYVSIWWNVWAYLVDHHYQYFCVGQMFVVLMECVALENLVVDDGAYFDLIMVVWMGIM
jgi:hypothetical protein